MCIGLCNGYNLIKFGSQIPSEQTTYSVGSFVISCFFFSKSKNSLDFERRHHKL